MQIRKFLLVLGGVLLIGGVIAVFLTPALVSTGLRLWIARIAQQEGLIITFEKLEAPLLRPAVFEKVQIASREDDALESRITVQSLEIALSFGAIVGQSHGRFLHSLTANQIDIGIRRNAQSSAASPKFACHLIEHLLADNFTLSGVQLHIENGETVVDLRDGTLSAAQVEAGLFSANDVTIASPWFHKSFSQLRGVTSWQDSQLTIGALSLTRGLDLDALNIDLSHIGESRIGLEVNLDAFGGKLRARISNENRGDQQIWDAAGTASEISLARMSDALDLTDRASGSLHGCKFTFRGEANNLREATASVWAEVTELTWRDRTADTLMIGASVYNHQIQIEQLFVKQRDNQFTLSGESTLPQKWSDWLNPDFHGDISASINDLGDFARLFGASASDFAGKIDISGNVNARERKLGGQLSASGNSLILFRAPCESLRVQVSLNESHLEVMEFELLRQEDSFQGQANIDLTGDHKFSFSVTSSVNDVGDYAALIPETLPIPPFHGGLHLNWSGQGNDTTYVGTFHASARGLESATLPFLPLNAELDADYSSDKIFFRQFNLSNQDATFDAFVTVARDYLQLQTVRFGLLGQPKLEGELFLPISSSKFYPQGNWLSAISDNPVFDVDINLDSTDLGELARAVMKQPTLAGQASGDLEIHGTPLSLIGKSTLHLRNFMFRNEPHVSAEMDARWNNGLLDAKASVTTRGSNPVTLEGTMPLTLEKQESGYAVNTDGALAATINFPAILLSTLPLYFSKWAFVDGVLNGSLAISDSAQHPLVRGSAYLINGRLLGNMSLSAGIAFEGHTARIDFAEIVPNNFRNTRSRGPTVPAFSARGSIDFYELNAIQLTITPNLPITALTPLEPEDCINGVQFLSNGMVGSLGGPQIDAIIFRGGLTVPNWTITLGEKHLADPLETFLRGGSAQTYPLCNEDQRHEKSLTLRLTHVPFPLR